MKIRFDNNLKIVGIGLTPWTRAGLERFMPNFSIACAYDWAFDVSSPKVYALDSLDPGNSFSMGIQNSQTLLNNYSFQEILNKYLPECDILTYKPVKPPEALSGRKFIISNNAEALNFEDKLIFRDKFASKLNFAGFKVIDPPSIEDVSLVYENLASELNTKVMVVQDPKLSGGKGTYIINSSEDFADAMEKIKAFTPLSKLIVSAYVDNAVDYSIQACVTDDQIYTGPLQCPIVGDKLLVKPGSGMRFTGAVIDSKRQYPDLLATAQNWASVVGEELKKLGYRGIFGLDLLVDKNQTMYIVEANIRITGVTPLLTAFYKEDQVPFYLLHVLASGKYDYQIVDSTINQASYGDNSVLIMHNVFDEAVEFSKVLKTGVYRCTPEKGLEFIEPNRDLNSLAEDEYFISPHAANVAVKPSELMARIYMNSSATELDGTLKQDVKLMLEKIYEKC